MSDISVKLQACIKAMESEHSGKVEKIKQSRQRVEDLKNNMKQIVQEIKQKEDSITSAEAEVEALLISNSDAREICSHYEII